MTSNDGSFPKRYNEDWAATYRSRYDDVEADKQKMVDEVRAWVVNVKGVAMENAKKKMESGQVGHH